MGPGGEQNAENALTPGKNLFFRGPFHNPFLIIIYNKYDIACNTPILVLFFHFIFSYLKTFFWSDGGPLAGGGPRHVPIVPRPLSAPDSMRTCIPTKCCIVTINVKTFFNTEYHFKKNFKISKHEILLNL